MMLMQCANDLPSLFFTTNYCMSLFHGMNFNLFLTTCNQKKNLIVNVTYTTK